MGPQSDATALDCQPVADPARTTQGGRIPYDSAYAPWGSDVRVEGAAGSQYATVAVTIDATLRNGRRQHFEGTYTMRRSMVDGASAEQRARRI